MIDKEKHIEERINKTLEILDNKNKVTANPFLYTKIQAKLEKSNEPKPILLFDFVERFRLKPILVISILVINILSVSYYMSNSNLLLNNREENIANMVDLYDMDYSDFYISTSMED